MRARSSFAFLVILAGGLLAGCGRPPRINAEFIPYVKRFEAESAGLVVNSDISFKKLDGYRGWCQPSETENNQVWIDPRAWADAEGDDTAREMLIFHELGHCELSRPHDNRRDYEGDYVSLMTSVGLSNVERAYERDRTRYVDELFHRSR